MFCDFDLVKRTLDKAPKRIFQHRNTRLTEVLLEAVHPGCPDSQKNHTEICTN